VGYIGIKNCVEFYWHQTLWWVLLASKIVVGFIGIKDYVEFLLASNIVVGFISIKHSGGIYWHHTL
jgi:hypothetical protein